MGKRTETPVKFDEDIRPADYNELQRTYHRNRNIGSAIFLILFVALLVFFGIRYYQRLHRPAPPAEEKPAGENLWVPGIDYQPATDEGN